MKVIHIESGLGNQMLSYAEYLVIKKLNPQDDCYIETIIYEIPECNEVICQWNGYELNRIFGIDAPNISSLFPEEEWKEILSEIRESRFWEDGWRYAPIFCEVFKKHGLELENYLGDTLQYNTRKSWKRKLFENRLGYALKRWSKPFTMNRLIKKMDATPKIFIQNDKNVFTGQTLGLRIKGADIGFVHDEILKAFTFPPLDDEKNIGILEKINNTQSVAIHARRGDMLKSNGWCYKYGYFKRAVKYIKRHVKNPVFFFFCDTGSIEWVKENLKIFKLDEKKDEICFVDWNKGGDSYKDMQLISACKHNIITNSSFGWWGAYFNSNPYKITCSPNIWQNTTHNC